jgi:hypothetical protein
MTRNAAPSPAPVPVAAPEPVVSNETAVLLPLYPEDGNPEQFADIEFGTPPARMLIDMGATSKNGPRPGELLGLQVTPHRLLSIMASRAGRTAGPSKRQL